MTDKLLRDYEVKKLGGRGTKVMLYPELNKYKNIDHLFDENGDKIALLYINEQDDNSTTGHWVCLMRNQRNGKTYYELFDSYGKMPDEHFDEFPARLRKELHQGINKLTRLMYKRLKGNEKNTVIEFNEIPYQRVDPRIATCGRWCGLRLRHGKISLEEFQKIISDSKRPHDELVVDMSDQLLGRSGGSAKSIGALISQIAGHTVPGPGKPPSRSELKRQAAAQQKTIAERDAEARANPHKYSIWTGAFYEKNPYYTGGSRSKVNWKFIDVMKKVVPPVGKIAESAAYLGNDFRKMPEQEQLKYMREHQIGPYRPGYKNRFQRQDLKPEHEERLIRDGYADRSDFGTTPEERKQKTEDYIAFLKMLKERGHKYWEYDREGNYIGQEAYRDPQGQLHLNFEKGESYKPSTPVLPSASNAASLATGITQEGLNIAHLAKKAFGHGKMRFDLHKFIGKLPLPKRGLVPPGYNFLGPYNNLEKQLDYNKKTGEIYKIHQQPTNKADHAAMLHDVCYEAADRGTGSKHDCDRKMRNELAAMTFKEKGIIGTVAEKFMHAKQLIGFGYPLSYYEKMITGKGL